MRRVGFQLKDIPNDVVLQAVRDQQIEQQRGSWKGCQRRDVWALGWGIEARLKQFPLVFVRLKLKKLKAQGIIDGCECGCRGDWHFVGEHE